jgi:cytochrome P450 monooxygenase
MHFEIDMASIWLVTVALLLVIYLLQRALSNSSLKHIPILKFNRYLPDFINRLIYYPKAASLIYRGYKQYKDCPFRMLTADGEVVVLPVKYTEELRKLPASIISSLDAQYEVKSPPSMVVFQELISYLSVSIECAGRFHQYPNQ